MIWLARYDEVGKYTWFGNATIGVDPVSEPGLYIGKRVDPLTQYHDPVSNAPVSMPPKPSEAHEFNWATKCWVLNTNTAWEGVKRKRTRLLTECDWVTLRATESGQPIDPAWLVYRQALRDITLQTDPTSIVWPVDPYGRS